MFGLPAFVTALAALGLGMALHRLGAAAFHALCDSCRTLVPDYRA